MAVTEGLFVGLFIPAISAVIPIQRALLKTLSDSLNVARSQTKGVIFTIEKSSSKMVVPYLLFGGISVSMGVTIYYFLPYCLISNNASLLLNIFFFILLGLIFGLTLLAVNLRGLLEKILIYALLFWEKKSMRNLIRKNLIAHKRTN